MLNENVKCTNNGSALKIDKKKCVKNRQKKLH